MIGEKEISSTLVREEILQGHMEYVTAMLGRPFCIAGRVLRGKQLGRTIGFPTANLMAPDNKILPPDGVYATMVTVLDQAESSVLTPGHEYAGHKKTSVSEADRQEADSFRADRQEAGLIRTNTQETGLRGESGRRTVWRGITNLGRRPTFDDGEQRTVETYLFDFDGDLYDKKINVEFLHFIRPERKFDDVEQLREQMKQDVLEAQCTKINILHKC